jgi:formate hydrogenlyase subunit 3/multisubunit Na+/H+ antiporter MnhD subunit
VYTVCTEPMLLPISFAFLAGIVCLLLPSRLDKERAIIAVVSTVFCLLLVWPLFTGPAAVRSWGPGLSFRVDGLSRMVLLAVAVFGVLIAMYSAGFMKGRDRLNQYYAYFLWTLGASFGAVLANDLILLLVFWGVLALTLYLMIGIGGADASAAAKKTFIIVGGSDSVLLLGIALVWHLTGTTRMDGRPLALQGEASYLAFLCFAAAAFAKAGAMPLHTWVPDCGEKAPVPVAAFLPASLDKLLGIYLLARAATGIFEMNAVMNSLMMLLGALTIVFAVMMALVQHDMKRLLSYHAVSQVGYMILGIGTGNPVGLAGALFHMLNNAIYKSSLFLCAGAVESQTGTTDLEKLGGLSRSMRITFAATVIAALSISAIPPSNGFASKWMVYQGIVDSRGEGSLWVIWLAAAMFGSALTLASFTKLLHAVFLRRPGAALEQKPVREVGPALWLPMAVLSALCIAFGVFAHRLPLGQLVFPAVGEDIYLPGVWWAGPATVMLVASFALGALLLLLTVPRKLRVTETYTGGEIIGRNYIAGEKAGATSDVEVSGVDFYRNVQDIAPLRTLYRLAEKKVFDIYDVGIAAVFYFVEALRKAHSGLLPLYLTWVMAGLIAIMYVLLRIWG